MTNDNLSEKIKLYKGEPTYIRVKDVREAVKKLKEYIEKNAKGIPPVLTYGDLFVTISEIFGEELSKWVKEY